MKYFKDFKNLCTPASVYLFINVIIFITIAVQNFGNNNKYCVGQYTCNVPSTFSMFLFKAIYMLFWTFILNAICKAGYKEVSWFMVLLPIILLFIIIGLVILNNGSSPFYEGFREGNSNGEEHHSDNHDSALTEVIKSIQLDEILEDDVNNKTAKKHREDARMEEVPMEEAPIDENFANLLGKKNNNIEGFKGFIPNLDCNQQCNTSDNTSDNTSECKENCNEILKSLMNLLE